MSCMYRTCSTLYCLYSLFLHKGITLYTILSSEHITCDIVWVSMSHTDNVYVGVLTSELTFTYYSFTLTSTKPGFIHNQDIFKYGEISLSNKLNFKLFDKNYFAMTTSKKALPSKIVTMKLWTIKSLVQNNSSSFQKSPEVKIGSCWGWESYIYFYRQLFDCFEFTIQTAVVHPHFAILSVTILAHLK